ncbi:MAG: hypothetical protein QOG51_2219, partial [Verrucomicrobiota bacterium]
VSSLGLFPFQYDDFTNINKNFSLALFGYLRSGILWDGGVLRGKLRQLPDLAPDRGERVPCLSPSPRPSDHRLHGRSDARRDHFDNSPPLVSTSIYSPVDGLAGDRVAAGRLDFHRHHSVADPGTIECGRLVAAADRPLARDQFLVSPSAIHCQCISFSVDDVRVAAGKCQAAISVSLGLKSSRHIGSQPGSRRYLNRTMSSRV